jgi:hypothetical protein
VSRLTICTEIKTELSLNAVTVAAFEEMDLKYNGTWSPPGSGSPHCKQVTDFATRVVAITTHPPRLRFLNSRRHLKRANRVKFRTSFGGLLQTPTWHTKRARRVATLTGRFSLQSVLDREECILTNAIALGLSHDSGSVNGQERPMATGSTFAILFYLPVRLLQV